jgi:hypothetical protein
MVFHTTFSFTHVRPRKRKIDGWEFWENLVRFSGWEDYHKQGLRDAGEGEKNGIGTGNWQRKISGARWVIDGRTSVGGDFGGGFGAGGSGGARWGFAD